MPPVKMRGDGRMAKNPKNTLLRLLSYLKNYAAVLLLVLLCIFLTAFAVVDDIGGILVIALRILRAEDVRSIPKGEKIIKLLRLK